jgi:hypothetical protein
VSAYPRWLLLEQAAFADLPLRPVPPQPAAPQEHLMKTCTKCGRPTTSADRLCGNRARAKCAELSSGGAVTANAEPAAPKRARPPKKPSVSLSDGETWQSKFNRLHLALGLDPVTAIEAHCRTWVEATTSRALGEPAKPVRLHPRRFNADGTPRADSEAAAEG